MPEETALAWSHAESEHLREMVVPVRPKRKSAKTILENVFSFKKKIQNKKTKGDICDCSPQPAANLLPHVVISHLSSAETALLQRQGIRELSVY